MHLVDDETRVLRRTAISIPVFVELMEPDGTSWGEHGWLHDISKVGAGFSISRHIDPGCIVMLRSRLPKEHRQYDFSKTEYSVWALVRRCVKRENAGGQHYLIGAALVGKNSPSGHSRNPGTLYDLEGREPDLGGFWKLFGVEIPEERTSSTVNKRRETRFRLAESVLLESVDSRRTVLASETTVTENVSRNGASVFSQLSVGVGAIVRVTVLRDKTVMMAIVRSKNVGDDAMPRLHLEFIDKQFPLDGLD